MRPLIYVLAAVLALVLVAAGAVLIFPALQDRLLARFAEQAFSTQRPPPYDGLQVFMCGTSSPLPAPDRAQACVAVTAGADLYLVDAGARSPHTFNLAGVPLDNLRAILLTHFHSDHIAAIGDFNLLSWVGGRPQPLQVIGPQGVAQVADGFNLAYAQDSAYRTAHHGAALMPPHLSRLQPRTIEPGVVLDKDGLTITAFTVDHAPIEPAVGYRFDYRGRSVVVSGDSVAAPSLRQAAEGADLLLHDAISLPIVRTMEAGARAAGRERQAKILYDIQDYHASTDSVYALAQEAGVGRLGLYHFVPPPRNALLEIIFRRDAPPGVLFTEDAMRISLPAGRKDIEVH